MKRTFVVIIDDVEPEESVITPAFLRLVLRQNPYACATNPEVVETTVTEHLQTELAHVVRNRERACAKASEYP